MGPRKEDKGRTHTRSVILGRMVVWRLVDVVELKESWRTPKVDKKGA